MQLDLVKLAMNRAAVRLGGEDKVFNGATFSNAFGERAGVAAGVAAGVTLSPWLLCIVESSMAAENHGCVTQRSSFGHIGRYRPAPAMRGRQHSAET